MKDSFQSATAAEIGSVAAQEPQSSMSGKVGGGSTQKPIQKTIVVYGTGSIGTKVVQDIMDRFSRDDEGNKIQRNDEIKILMYNHDHDKPEGYKQDLDGARESDDERDASVKFDIRAIDNISEIASADAIVFAAGVSAASLNTNNREASLPINSTIIQNFVRDAKSFLNEKSAIFVVTNPVDVVSGTMYDEIGIKGVKVVGVGSEIDSRRFCRSFKEKLNKKDNFPHVARVEGAMIGSHSNSMFLVDDSVKILFQEGSTAKLDQYPKGGDVRELCKESEIEARSKGFEIVSKIKKGGAAFEPAFVTVRMLSAYLRGYKSEGLKTMGSISFSEEMKYLSKEDGHASAPLHITEGKIEIDKDRFRLSTSGIIKFVECCEKHKHLQESVDKIPSILRDRMMDRLKVISELVQQVSGEAGNELQKHVGIMRSEINAPIPLERSFSESTSSSQGGVTTSQELTTSQTASFSQAASSSFVDSFELRNAELVEKSVYDVGSSLGASNPGKRRKLDTVNDGDGGIQDNGLQVYIPPRSSKFMTVAENHAYSPLNSFRQGLSSSAPLLGLPSTSVATEGSESLVEKGDKDKESDDKTGSPPR